MLCKRCITLFNVCEDKLAWIDERTIHHPDAHSLIQSANEDCPICKPLFQWARNQADPDLDEDKSLNNCVPEPWHYLCERAGSSEEHLRILIFTHVFRGGDVVPSTRVLFALRNSSPTTRALSVNFCVRERQTQRRKSGISISAAVDVTRQWTERCVGAHDGCQKNLRPRWYPTRLLRICPDGTIRLILSATDTELNGPYATLSYCWGPPATHTWPRLSDSNLAEFQRGITIVSLPIAFQESIDFLTRLSIHGTPITYIWIDSFCIVQDGPTSAADWRAESGRMADVYSHSVLNLSLSLSNHPGQSCLSLPENEESCAILPFEWTDTTTEEAYTVISAQYHAAALYDQPLSHRAWVLQERLLAPRVLSFGVDEVFWECASLPHACESFPEGLGPLTREVKPWNLIDASIPDTTDVSALRTAWWRILEDYTARALSFPQKDKLMALSAVASRLEEMLGQRWVAGHFLEKIPVDLHWSVKVKEGDVGSAPRRMNFTVDSRDKDGRKYRVPSWSWASMDGPLKVRPGDFHPDDLYIEVLGWKMVPVGVTETGEEIVSEAVSLKTFCVEVEALDGRLVVPDKAINDRCALAMHKDDPNEVFSNGSKYILAVVAECFLLKFEGLVLQALAVSGKTLHRRIGYYDFRVIDSDGTLKFKSKDYEDMCGSQKRALQLI